MLADVRGVNLGAQRGEAGLKVCGVKLEGHAVTSAEKQATRLLPCTDVLRESFYREQECLDPQTPRHERFDTHH